MKHTESRRTITDILRHASVFTLQNKNLEGAYTQGLCDIEMKELDMDSLAVMEICIALEMQHNLPLRPEDLLQINTLGELAARLDGAKK